MTDENVPTNPDEITRLSDMIRDLGYKAQPLNDHSIQTGMSGFQIVLFYFHEHSLQMYAGFGPLEHFGLEHANAFNEEHRFAKCYVVPSGIRFEGDFFFDINDEHANDDLQLILRSWEIVLGFVSEALNSPQGTSGKIKEDQGPDRYEGEVARRS